MATPAARATDCVGAGQAVTADFAGRSWRDDDETMREMYDAFAVVRAQNLRILRAQLSHALGG